MKIVIIGNGISGVTAARFIRKWSDHEILMISTETQHFFSRTALMYVYMGHMRYTDIKPYEDWFWVKNRIQLKQAYVQTIDSTQKILHLDNEETISYDRLILATGSKPNKFGWPGQDADAVQGLYSYQDLEGMEKYSKGLKHAVIVGGGLIGVEMAEMFHSRHIPVTFLVREKNYWSHILPKEESEMVGRHILENNIDLRLETELKEILTDEKGKARAVITNKGEEIPCQFVGLTAGVHPNIHFLRQNKKNNIELGKGILVNNYLETSVKGIYAIGDCAQLKSPQEGRRPIEAIWYTGRMMGETVAHTICKKPIEYRPQLWFNSAKFLEIEYQVYGDVRAHPPKNHKSIYWEHADGRKSIRIIYDQNEGHVIGFNLMGVRYRHEICEKWLKEKTPIGEVMKNLALANFDPEFYTIYEPAILKIYNKDPYDGLVIAKQKRGLTSALKYLRGKLSL